MSRLLTSKEIKNCLSITDCELSYLRAYNRLTYEKRGNAFLYNLPSTHSILASPFGNQLLNWHKKKHAIQIENKPLSRKSIAALEKLVWDILIPLERKFSTLTITYGFTSFSLKKIISKHFAENTAPTLDQHSSYEINSVGKPICSRGGAACDFFIENVLASDVVKYITKELDFDRIYYYGRNNPLHVSVNLEESARHLQAMKVSDNGRRYPAEKAHGESAVALAEALS